MNTISADADFFTEVQTILSRAKKERKQALLKEAAALLDGHQFLALPEGVQHDLSAQYADALFHVTGGMTP